MGTNGGKQEFNTTTTTTMNKYLIVRPENGGIIDLFWFWVSSFDDAGGTKFIEMSTSDDDDDDGMGPISEDHRWVIIVSIVVRKIIAVFGKPMEWSGYLVEFVLNLLAQNGELFGLIYNILRGKVVMPRRDSDTYISAIGHLDRRVDLYENDVLTGLRNEIRDSGLQIGGRVLMDFCMMSSKLAYENSKAIQNIVDHGWKMHFVDFFNGWNEFQKERSTQVFILCDKPSDANLILISFRGTEPFDADDWSTDFDYSWYEIPKLGKVHMGFLEALGLGNRTNTSTFQEHLQLGGYNSQGTIQQNQKKELIPEMVEMSAYYAVRSKLKSLLEEHKDAKFIVTGHSLGGALAILFPTVLVLHEEMETMQRLLGVYTFGQPRVGDRKLGRVMEAHLNYPSPKYLRVVYCNDLVPRLPYDNETFLFKHFGLCVYYDSNYIEQRMDEEPNKNYFGMRYLIPEYVNAVWELIRALTMSYTYGQDYKEGWFSIVLRVMGLALPGISAHSPTNYINSVRLGRKIVQMSSI